MSDVTANIAYVRTKEKAPLPPPRRTTGMVAWMRENLFSSWSNTALTLLGAWLLYSIVPPILDWALFSATFTGTDRQACLRDGAGACWPFIDAKFDQFIYGRYPLEETVEGFEHTELPIFAVQYHPEASPGPHDANYLFQRFVDVMRSGNR